MTSLIHGDNNKTRVLQRINHAITLFNQGHNWDHIAQEVGYASRGSAYKAVTDHLRRDLNENTETMRALEDLRLDADEKRLRQIIIESDDDATVIAAINARGKVSAARRRLWGLDAPVRVEVSQEKRREVEDAFNQISEALGVVIPGEATEVPPEELT